MKIGLWKKKKQINWYLLSSHYNKIILGSFFFAQIIQSHWEKITNILWRYLLLGHFKTQRMNSNFFSSFHNRYMRKKLNLLWKAGWKKGNHAIPANLFNMILPEKDQWHVMTFEAKTKRFKMLIINVGKKVHKNIGISQTPSCNISSNWCGKMMDIDAARKCWILVQKLSKCLNLLLELIYF